MSPVLSIRQLPPQNGFYPIRLTLKRPNQPDIEAEASLDFKLTAQEQEDLRWYMEDYGQKADAVPDAHIEQIEAMIKARGVELYDKLLDANRNTRNIWYEIRNQLADLRIEINAGTHEAASIPWELLRDPESDSAIAVRVLAFVRVQSNPNISFVSVPNTEDGRIRLLYVVCRPDGRADVSLRAIANRLLQGLEKAGQRQRFDITALRPPTFEQLQKTLTAAKEVGRPFHIVHFDGHGVYADLEGSTWADWLPRFSSLMLGGKSQGKQGYLLFEHPGREDNVRPVSGDELGKLLHDTGVPLLVLNACQTAMHEAAAAPEPQANVHDEIRAIGSLAQAVVDQGIPAVLGMRYSVFVVTAAQFIGELYAALASGNAFGHAASKARRNLHDHPDRWIGLQPKPLQDWFVPVIYEAMPLKLPEAAPFALNQIPELDPVQRDPSLLRYVPDTAFIGRDETLLLLDRAFDSQRIVLLHAYAGQGKTSTSVEFARWYAQTGGLSPSPQPPSPSGRGASTLPSPRGGGAGGEGNDSPPVLFTSFETHKDLTDLLNQIGQHYADLLRANNIEWHSLNDASQRRQIVLQILRAVPLLWIWDNVEPVAGFPAGSESSWTLDEQRQLAEFLKQIKQDQASRAKILLTSRRDEQAWLGGVPFRIEMPRMSRADAAKLVLELGQERGWKQADIANWHELLNYCHGNPLTLRIIGGQAARLGLRGREPIAQFIQAVRDGEQAVDDCDETQGRDRSLGASLAYGFNHAFTAEELPVIALLHLFQGVVDVDVLAQMGQGDYALAELQGLKSDSVSKPDPVSIRRDWLTGLLHRAAEIGLLTSIGRTWFNIHPALPWFLWQVFARYYDGKYGRSSAEAALRAWVVTMGDVGDYYTEKFVGGNRHVIQVLALEEANMHYARHLARRQGRWHSVTSAMQGLRVLYEYQGRNAEWARLVAEIVPDYCAADDKPLKGREPQYSLVMGYRVDLARQKDRNLVLAAALQEKLTEWDRQQAAAALALPDGAPLDTRQHNYIRNLGASLEGLGHIQREQNSGACVVAAYEEAIDYYRRIGDTAAEATAEFNLGRAYHEMTSLRDLDAAAAAYQRSLELRNTDDALSRGHCLGQIGLVHHEHFIAAQERDNADATLLQLAQIAESYYLQTEQLLPADAPAEGWPLHNNLGRLYLAIGQTELAREQYEKAVQLAEQTGDRHHAGTTRYNLALMYWDSADRQAAHRRELLLRARAYAEAALADYRHYQGRAADQEANAQQLIADIDAALQQP